MANIGYETIGGSQRALNGACRGLRVTMAEGGAAGVTITAYLNDSATGDSFRAAVVDNGDNDTILASSDIRTDISTAGWYTFSGGTLASFTPANGTTYVIAAASMSVANANLYHDSNTASIYQGWAASVATIDPLDLNGDGVNDTTRDYSIYMTYTAAGAAFIAAPNKPILQAVQRASYW